MKTLTTLAVAVLLTGCASSAKQIGENHVDTEWYLTDSCKILKENIKNHRKHVAVLTEKQNTASSMDAKMVFLWGLPLASMSGENVAEELAQAKGELSAMKRAYVENRCINKQK